MASYTIKSGDTLSGLAAKNGVSVSAIMAANPSIKDANKIYSGNSITIPTALPQSTTPTIQTTTAQRTQDIATQNKYNEVVASKTPVVTPSGNTPVGGASATSKPAPTNGAGANALTVMSYVDNPDGTTTNTLSDGSTSTVRYIRNTDGSLTPIEINNSNKPKSAIDTAEGDYSAKIRQQINDLDTQKEQFDSKIDQLSTNNNAVFQSTLASIKATFGTRRDQLKNSYNSLVGSRAKAGYQTDAFRYTPTHEEGLVTNDENNYVSDLASLDAQEQSLILQAATAKEAKDWDALQKQMTLYDQTQTKKAELLGKLLTVAQDQNKRIEAEQKIAREANKLPSGSEAATIAKSVAPAMVAAVKGLSADKKEAYITSKAASLKIDKDVLRSALIDQGVQDLKDAKSLKAGSGSGSKPTESEKKASFVGQLNAAMTDTNAKINGAPVIDVNGFLTPAGYKHLVQVAYKNGIKKADFITQYSDKFYLDGIDSYGLTAKEQELLGL